MERGVQFTTSPSPCEYLPDQQRQLLYELRVELEPPEYMLRLQAGWRRFGPVLFRPDCEGCQSCQSLRVPVAAFSPSESQRRVLTRNARDVEIHIADPSIDSERQELFARFHRHGHEVKGWPDPDDEDSRLELYLRNPFRTEEWSFRIDGRLVGLGYVDALPEGLSAIYFVHDPDEHRRSLGTFNVLKMIEAARDRALPHVYLGYYVRGCRSLEYKARFRPSEILSGERWEAR